MLALIVAMFGYLCITQSLALVLTSRAPARAYALNVADGRINAVMAHKLAGLYADPGSRDRANALARRALRQDATAVPAVVTLGLDAGIRGDAALSRRLFGYAEQLSRRDTQTQIWYIEDSVAQGNIPAALRHYDIALRTSSTAPDLLYPVLTSALTEPKIRSTLSMTLARGAPWRENYIDYASTVGEPRAILALVRDLARQKVKIALEPQSRIMVRLVSANSAAEAWTYYTQLHPGMDHRRSRDPRFRAGLAVPSPFDWTPVNDEMGISSSIQRATDGSGIFEFNAPASIGGSLLRQAQLLPSGTYQLSGHSMGIDQPADSRPYWVLTCADGRELGRVDVPNSDQADGMFTGLLTVPKGCAMQMLTLVARPSEAIGGVSGQIDRALLMPLS